MLPLQPVTTPEVEAFIDRKQVEWTRRDVRRSFEMSKRRGSKRVLVPVDALERLLHLAGA